MVSIGITSAQVPSSANSGDLIAGRALYFEHACYSCHGYTGETGQMPLLGSAFLLSEELFLIYLRLRADQNPLLPSTRMPNYSEESLSDEQALNIYTYIRSFQSTTPELEDSPTKAIRLMGEDLALYKDKGGTYGLIDLHCPHRRSDLSYGFVVQVMGLLQAAHVTDISVAVK